MVWSQHSVKSHWVRAEAAYALGKHKLVTIAIDKSAPPLQFHHIQTIDFDGWNGAGHDEAFTRLLTVLAKRLDRAGALGGGRRSAQPPSLRGRRNLLRRRRPVPSKTGS